MNVRRRDEKGNPSQISKSSHSSPDTAVQCSEFMEPQYPISSDDPAEDSSTPYFDSVQHTHQPHDLELEISHLLLALEDFEFASLQVRHVDKGICLSGRIEAAKELDLRDVVRQIEQSYGVPVQNRLTGSHTAQQTDPAHAESSSDHLLTSRRSISPSR